MKVSSSLRAYGESWRLIQTTQELATKRNLDELAAMVSASAREMLMADGGTLVLLEESKTHYIDESAVSPLFKGQRFPAQQCICGWAINNNSAVAIEDVHEDDRIARDAYRNSFVTSLLAVPIRTNPPRGSIAVYWSDKHKATDVEVELLESLASSTAVAMDNIQLFDAQQQQLARLEELNRLKDEFLSLVSHELRTPLNAILGWSTLLSQGQGADLADLLYGIGIIRGCADDQRRVVDELLDASEFVHQMQLFGSEIFDLRDVLARCIAKFQPFADAANSDICYESIGTPVYVSGDETRIQQSVECVLSNAIKFGRSSNRVTVELSNDTTTANISVADTGIGIEPSFLPRVFDRFHQRDSSYARRHGGLGLGLFLARHIVEHQGGEMAAVSPGLGLGSTFTIRLPLAAVSKPSSSSTRAPRSRKLDGVTVVALDSSETSLELLKRLLAAKGAKTETFVDSGMAMERILTRHSDILICELGLYDDDGIEFVKRLRGQNHHYRELPAIALTSFASFEDQTRALQAGFNAFCRKPLDLNELTIRIGELI